LFLNLEFFFLMCLLILFPVCLSTTSPCWFLWFSLSLSFFLSILVLLVLLL
jgi:hypothetical protein